jgi:hypothetical protein
MQQTSDLVRRTSLNIRTAQGAGFDIREYCSLYFVVFQARIRSVPARGWKKLHEKWSGRLILTEESTGSSYINTKQANWHFQEFSTD